MNEQTLEPNLWSLSLVGVSRELFPTHCISFTILLPASGFEFDIVFQHVTGSRESFADVPTDLTIAEYEGIDIPDKSYLRAVLAVTGCVKKS